MRQRQFVAMSGGIDSTALALLMPDAELVFTDTGDEFPELYAHLDRFERTTGRVVNRIQPFGSLPDYEIEHRFLPNFSARFCTRIFKIDAFNHWLADKLPVTMCVALRADEKRSGNLTNLSGLEISYPLQAIGYRRVDVVRVCLEHDLLPRYPVYMARGGCAGCYFKRKSEVLAMREIIPDVYSTLKDREETVQDERGKTFYMFPNLGMSLAEFERQPVLFDQDEVWRDAGSREQYGQSCGMFCHR